MSNYIKATNFATKDALPTGSALKTLSGTELDTEFNRIVTAVATKADTSSPVLTGTPTAPTAAAGTDTLQLATTAFVQAATPTAATINALVYPVGAIFTTVVSYTPSTIATLMGLGTWAIFGSGKTLVGLDAADTDFDIVESSVGTRTVGGRKDAVLPTHHHKLFADQTVAANYSAVSDITASTSVVDNTNSNSPSEAYVLRAGTAAPTTGISSTEGVALVGNENLMPYITVYFWKRTA